MIDNEVILSMLINDAISVYHNGKTKGALQVEVDGNIIIYLCILCHPGNDYEPCATIYKALDGTWKHEALLPHLET